MGADLNIKVGTYLVVTTKNKKVPTKIWSCENESCKNHDKELKRSNAFCPKCGNKCGQLKREQIVELSTGEILEKYGFEDSLISADNMGSVLPGLKKNQEVLYNNEHSPFDKTRDIDENGGVYCLDSLDVETEKIWFRKTYSEEISKLEESFGKENVKLHWGIITYWS